MKNLRIIVLPLSALLLLAACEQGTDGDGPAAYASRYKALPSEATILKGATVLTGTGERLDNADVVMDGGKIIAVGPGLDAGSMTVVDASGMWITPGVIDAHSHLGVYASPPGQCAFRWQRGHGAQYCRSVGPSTASGRMIRALSRHLPAV